MISECSSDTEDSSKMQSSERNSEFHPQRTLWFNKLLPYADQLEAESQALLCEIKENLGRAVILREMKPGCALWSSRLDKYIYLYGMRFSKEDHIIFVKLMYELVTIPNLGLDLLNKFASTLILLLKKKELISFDELELPWRPLYELIRRLRTNSTGASGLYRYPSWLKNILRYMIRAVKTYFPLSATQEILDELRPTLYPLDGMTMSVSFQTLECFLPLQLPPKYHSIGHQLWFDEFMTTWKVCHNAPQWENDIMWLMARLAIYNVGYIDWEPYFPLMFTRFIRCLNLPVAYKKVQHIKNNKIEVAPITIWITAVLGNGSNAQMYLEKFLKTIETYLHPANFGRWLGKLKDFLIKLSYNFILRLHKEKYAKPTWETPIPDNYKLTDSNIDAFVKSMMPVVVTAMFGSNEICYALQYLANIRPNLVIPTLLERMYSTFDSLTEPHKLTASMISMTAVVRPMVQGSRNINKGYTYPEGPTHVLPLLFSSLPGIDPNDLGKCFATFRLISAYATLIPIVDSSRSTADMTEEERMICEATSRFEDFVLQFLDRVFMFIDSSSLEYVRLESRAGNKSKAELVAETALMGVCTTLLIESSDTIFESALHKLRTFMTERILETKVAGRLAAIVCKSFTRFNGRDTLRALLPVFTETILHMVGEGEDLLKEENLDHRLLHVMLLLSAIVDTPGNNLIPHMDTLLKVLDHVLLLKSTEGNKLACNLLRRILLSLSTIAPCQYISNERGYNDPNYLYIKDWGENVDINTFCIKWYVPGEEEIAIMQRIFSRYLTPQIDKLKEYCKDSSTLSRDDLLISLNIICSIITGSDSVLPVWVEEPLELRKSSLTWIPLLPTYGIQKNITMPDGSNVRYYIVGIMSEVQQAMLENAEDNTKSFFTLIQIWTSLLLGKVRSRESHEATRKNFQYAKKLLEDKLVGNKSRIGPIILERCYIQHEARVLSQLVALTETHKRVMLELFQLATSRYAKVRSKAQSSLFSALKYFRYSYTIIIPHFIDILARDTEEHHNAYKSVLYMLLGPQLDPIITKPDWNMLRQLWPAIVLSKTSEKLSVISLREHIAGAINKCFPTVTIKLEIPDRCLTAARALWKNFPQPTLPQPNETEIEEGVWNLKQLNESNSIAYTGLLEDLLNCIIEKPLHWRHRLMAMGFIRDLVQIDETYSARIVRYFLQALIHDSLQERKIAIKIVRFILKQQKRKHPKVTVDIQNLFKESTLKEGEELHVTPGVRADNSWLQYNYKTRPLTADQWDEPRYVHQTHIGYYAWPKTLEVYAPFSQQPCLDPQVRKLTDCEKEIDIFFDDPYNIEKFIGYLSLEEKKGKDKFSVYRSLLFKGLFRNHGSVHLKHFIPHLQRLVADKHESSQRCAAEITAGIIRGAKHWPFQMTCDMWEALLPIIRTALSNLTEESIADWGMCFANAQKCRDPNRHHWLLECLMEEPSLKDSESSIVECGRLYVLQTTLHQQSWRVTELLQRLLVRLEDRLLTNPFQNVRDRMGLTLVTVFNADLNFPYTSPNAITPRMQTLISKIVPKLSQLIENDNECLVQEIADVKLNEDLSAHTEAFEKPISVIKREEQEMPKRLLKTVCKWIVGSLYHSQYGAMPAFYEIYPILCQLQSSEADEELNKSCLFTLGHLAQAFTLPENMPVALNSVKTVSEYSSWSARFISLEFLQVLVFHNMGIILSNELWIDCVKNIVLHLLDDDRLEVREKACQVLGGLLHCTFISDQDELLEQFKKKASTRLYKKNNLNNEDASRNAKIDAIRMRHAGVLGLCAFIHAHPYDVPKYVPPIFEHLGLHMNDPQPIQMTIRKTLSDFKRTHYDGMGMDGHAQHFTEEQLAVLQDLIAPPSHYT